MEKEYIPLNEFRMLAILFEYNGMITASEIADKLQVAKSHITNVSDKLIEKRLITQGRSPKDCRIIYISITNEGKELVKEIRQVLYQGYSKRFENFIDKEIQIFIDLLNKINTERT